MILRWATFIAILGCRLDTPDQRKKNTMDLSYNPERWFSRRYTAGQERQIKSSLQCSVEKREETTKTGSSSLPQE